MNLKIKTCEICAVLLLFFISGTTHADNSYPYNLYKRLTGSPLSPHRPDFADWDALIQKKDWPGLAKKAVEEPEFSDVTVLEWATIYYSAGLSANVPLNDGLATLVGSVRDNLDARLLLTGNYLYGPTPILALNPDLNSNTPYDVLSARLLSLSTGLQFDSPQWPYAGYEKAAGLLTTRSWALANYSAGTNRRAIKNAFATFLCRPIETWRVPNLPTYHIHQDVDRAPGGDARVFQQECRTCHGTLDGLVGAFAHLDYIDPSFSTSSGVLSKYLQHTDVYPEGYVTTDDSWINQLAITEDPIGKSFGWRGKTEGNGIESFGEMLSNSKEFGRCIAKRVFSSVCLQDLDLTDPLIQKLADEFETLDTYHLKDFFVRTALHPECISQR